jgi:hypothetical protein
MQSIARRRGPYAYEPCGGDAQAFCDARNELKISLITTNFSGISTAI